MMTPDEALAVSPLAPLSGDDKEKLAMMEDGVEKFLRNDWQGGNVTQACPPISLRVLAAFIRRWTRAGWQVQAQPMDGATAKAQQLLQAGADCGFLIVLLPMWRVPESTPIRSIERLRLHRGDVLAVEIAGDMPPDQAQEIVEATKARYEAALEVAGVTGVRVLVQFGARIVSVIRPDDKPPN